ncbi:hypothetical protein [Mycolicibacterium setense]
MSDEPITPNEQQPVDLDAAPAENAEGAYHEADSTPDTDTGGNAEAAKWRKRLRATETELTDRLQATETELTVERARSHERDRRECERIAADILIDGADVWRGAELADFHDDNGLPDPTKIRAHATDIARQHRHLFKPGTPAAATVTSDKSPYDDGASATSWQQVIRDGAR